MYTISGSRRKDRRLRERLKAGMENKNQITKGFECYA
jgi:hypothetical protein